MKKLIYVCLSLITLLFACTTKNKSNQNNNAENNNVLEVELFTENVISPEDLIDQDNDY